MAISNASNVKKRSDKTSPLTQAEVDGNFQEVRNVINDATQLEGEYDQYVIDNDQRVSNVEDGVYGLLEVPLSGSDITLSGTQLNYTEFKLTGTLTTNVSVITPTDERTYTIINEATGDFSVTVRTSAGTGVVVPQGQTFVVRCDGVDVVSPEFSSDSVAHTGTTDTVTEALDKRTIYVGSVAEGLSEIAGEDGREYSVIAWHSGGYALSNPVGGGRFVFRGAESKTGHNGGTIISPTVPPVSEQAGASLSERVENFLNGVGETDPSGSGVFVRENSAEVWVEDFGAIGDNSADDWAAINAAVNRDCRVVSAYEVYAGKVKLRDVRYYLSKTLNLKRVVHIEGMYGHIENTRGCILEFAADTKGIIVNRYNTIDSGVEAAPSGRADGSKIIGISLASRGGTNIYAHGLWLRARAVVENLRVDGFPGNNIHIGSSDETADSHENNANNWSLSKVRTLGSGRHGLFVDGPDANAGTASSVDSSKNKLWGIYDSSFLGNSYLGCHTATNGVDSAGGKSAYASFNDVSYHANPAATEADLVNTQPGTNRAVWRKCRTTSFAIPWTGNQVEGTYRAGGGYFVEGLNNRSTISGCYSEGGQGLTWLAQHTIAVGGLLIETPVTTGVHLKAELDKLESQSGFLFDGSGNSFKVRAELGGDPDNRTYLAFETFDSTGSPITQIHRLVSRGTSLVFNRNNLSSTISWEVTGLDDEFPDRFKVRDIVLGGGLTARRFGRVNYSTATGVVFPASGEYVRGDIYVAPKPIAGGKIGWVCTTSGTAGSTAVFKAFGAIDA